MAQVRMVKCIDCKHGRYMQWMKNPIICQCDMLDDRFVAEARRICTHFDKAPQRENIEIQHYDHY